ncbi:methyltransferase, TIGR04325 family [Chelatococcus reniformis]|uniref:Methyltransferase, TIGR04325 family n=1 Tax=Chelatococcus reniformis TaxID=1494448 RepID=A0A916UFK2_9HYPH|nr:methyltransferase, TIGR04325 family [Chelatococcus reniformis]GGC71899.1 hypothetical protein GCM10010994_32930 [Chelatococcus reniformis]
MNRLLKALLCHSVFGAWLRRLPFAQRLYARIVWSRRMNLMFGVFDSFGEAEAFAAGFGKVGWNDAALAKVLVEGTRPAASPAPPKVLQTSQFAVMLWLMKLLHSRGTVTDLGGAGGGFYELCVQYGLLDRLTRWHVVDMPEVVKRGNERHRALGSSKISFGTDLKAAPRADILLALGSLQCMADPLGERGPGILEGVRASSDVVLINKVPLIDGDDVWTAQNYLSSASPYRLFNRRKFFAYFERHGYRVVDRWAVPELAIEIPFHPERVMTELEGFCFMHDSAIADGSLTSRRPSRSAKPATARRLHCQQKARQSLLHLGP